MSFLEIIFAFMLGASLGSFLNVLILRLREGISILGRSRCPGCATQLHPRHLVPILSWLALRGRCSFCKHPIHIQYPLVELASACLVVLAYVRHPVLQNPHTWSIFLIECLLFLFLLSLVVFDLRWKLLPIEPIVIAILIFSTWNIASGSLSWLSVVLGAVAAGIFLGGQVLISHGRWMGEGDPWLGVLMGVVLGWPRVGIALYLTYVVGGMILLVLFLVRIVRKGTRIPFAPLLALGTLGTILWGGSLEMWFRALL